MTVLFGALLVAFAYTILWRIVLGSILLILGVIFITMGIAAMNQAVPIHRVSNATTTMRSPTHFTLRRTTSEWQHVGSPKLFIATIDTKGLCVVDTNDDTIIEHIDVVSSGNTTYSTISQHGNTIVIVVRGRLIVLERLSLLSKSKRPSYILQAAYDDVTSHMVNEVLITGHADGSLRKFTRPNNIAHFEMKQKMQLDFVVSKLLPDDDDKNVVIALSDNVVYVIDVSTMTLRGQVVTSKNLVADVVSAIINENEIVLVECC